MQHPRCITPSYQMLHPCAVRCLQTVTVLTVCMDKMVSHMIKQSSRIGNSQEIPRIPGPCQLSIIANGDFNTTHCQYFHVIFHVLWLILTADTTTVHGIAKTNNLVHIKMCYC